jgi:dihydropteroate synthase
MAATMTEILSSHRTQRPVVMGVLNVTPDSFSDGGEFFSSRDAIGQARWMIDRGADILDIGAESTRPGSERVSPEEQIERLRKTLPAVCDMAKRSGVHVSIDSTWARVASFALDAGASLFNDVSAGRDDPEMLPLAAERKTPIILMHMLGQPKTMQADPTYEDVVRDVKAFLAERIKAAEAAGIPREYCIPDPGIGFGKRLEHNLALLAGTAELCRLGVPILIGPSRKRFIGELSGEQTPANRLGGTIAACLQAFEEGATIFRVHDVAPVRQALTVAAAIRETARLSVHPNGEE